jgi:type I restriction enzyme M protein
MAQLLDAKPGQRIADPAIGSGSLAIAVAENIGTRDFKIYGQESNGSTWALAKMNMFLHSMDSARIEWGDTLNNPKLIENDTLMQFDIVVANPPFSLDKWGAEEAAADRYRRYHRGIPPKSKADYAFISHMIETCADKTGKVGVIVPHGVLFRGGGEGKIRQALIEENLLEAVIGLPSALFYGTGIPAAILIFNKGKANTNVTFIDASNEFEPGKRQNHLRSQDIDKIVEAFRTATTIAKYSHVATIEELRENEYNLNISRYVNTFEEEEEIDVAAVQREIEELEGELVEVRNQMGQYLIELGIGA